MSSQAVSWKYTDDPAEPGAGFAGEHNDLIMEPITFMGLAQLAQLV